MKTKKLMRKKKYDCENKNRLRELLVNKIREYPVNSILTLESPDFIFSKMLPDKKIIVFENDDKIMKKMEKKTPKNVDLIWGSIGKFGVFNSTVDMVWLDFCRTWMKEQTVIAQLKESLRKTKLFALTLCLRETRTHKEKGETFQGDYQFDLIKKIQDLTGLSWKVVYGESYYDSLQMVFIILENPIFNFSMKGGDSNEQKRTD